MGLRTTTAIVLTLFGAAATAAERQVEVLETRPGVRTEVLFMTQEGAIANVILFAGGTGRVTFYRNGEPNGYAGNFLVRSRDLFVQNGLNVAIPGAPSDRPQGLIGWKGSPEYAAELRAIIAAFRKRASLPTWVVGTSMGSIAVLAAAINVNEGGPDGLVFNASIVTPSERSLSNSMRLGEIRLPVLIQHHELDACKYTLYKDVKPFADGIVNSPQKRILSYRDGGPTRGDPCEAFGYHGFPGIEPKVVQDIARFIKGE